MSLAPPCSASCGHAAMTAPLPGLIPGAAGVYASASPWVDIVTATDSTASTPTSRSRPPARASGRARSQPGWDTPRGPLGGYVMAILMRGFELAVDDPDRSARSVSVHFLRSPRPAR